MAKNATRGLDGVNVTGYRDYRGIRPTVADDYSAGSFAIVLSDPAGRDIYGIALVETTTTVGDATLNSGDILFALQGASYDRSVWRWRPSTGLDSIELICGSDQYQSGD